MESAASLSRYYALAAHEVVMPENPKFKMVLIEWFDSAQPSTDWSWLENIPADFYKATRCRTVGWLVHDDPDMKAVAASISADNKQAIGITRIPACAVHKIEELVVSQPATLAELREQVRSRPVPISSVGGQIHSGLVP